MKAFQKLCRLTGKAIADFDMIQEGDRLLVGLSGGVDSMVLMHVLDRLQKRAPISFELMAVTVDEGFDGIDHAPLAAYAKSCGWDFKILESSIAQVILDKKAEDKPCPLCSRLRRGLIHGYANERNCNKMVLGHHRDDLNVSLLMGLFRGRGIKTMGPNVLADNETKRILRPMCYAPKSIIEESALAYEFPNVGECDYSKALDERGDRAMLERLLPDLEQHFPDLGQNMLTSMSHIREEYLLDPRFLK